MNNTKPAPRTYLELDISVKRLYARKSMTAHLKNLSLSGAFLELPIDGIFIDDKINATFIIAERVRTIELKVVWRNNEGLGVKFVFENNKDEQMIDDLLYYAESRQLAIISPRK